MCGGFHQAAGGPLGETGLKLTCAVKGGPVGPRLPPVMPTSGMMTACSGKMIGEGIIGVGGRDASCTLVGTVRWLDRNETSTVSALNADPAGRFASCSSGVSACTAIIRMRNAIAPLKSLSGSCVKSITRNIGKATGLSRCRAELHPVQEKNGGRPPWLPSASCRNASGWRTAAFKAWHRQREDRVGEATSHSGIAKLFASRRRRRFPPQPPLARRNR